MNDITLRDVIVWIIAALLAMSAIGGIVVCCGQITACNTESNRLETAYKLVHPPPDHPGCYDEIIKVEANNHWSCERGATATYVPFPPPNGMYVCHCIDNDHKNVSPDASVVEETVDATLGANE